MCKSVGHFTHLLRLDEGSEGGISPGALAHVQEVAICIAVHLRLCVCVCVWVRKTHTHTHIFSHSVSVYLSLCLSLSHTHSHSLLTLQWLMRPLRQMLRAYCPDALADSRTANTPPVLSDCTKSFSMSSRDTRPTNLTETHMCESHTHKCIHRE
jgi:hypothetical protein